MDWLATIIVGICAMIGTLGGAYAANRKNTALIAYRLEQLEKKVDKHNSVIERTYALEKTCGIREEQLRELKRIVEAQNSE